MKQIIKKTFKQAVKLSGNICRCVLTGFVIVVILCFICIVILHNTPKYKADLENCLARCRQNGYAEDYCQNSHCDFPI